MIVSSVVYWLDMIRAEHIEYIYKKNYKFPSWYISLHIHI